jgi:hypothetical protein
MICQTNYQESSCGYVSHAGARVSRLASDARLALERESPDSPANACHTPERESPDSPANACHTPERESPDSPANACHTPERESPDSPANACHTPERESPDSPANEPPYLCSDRTPWVACVERGRPGGVGWRSSRVPGGDPGLMTRRRPTASSVAPRRLNHPIHKSVG